MIFEKIIIKKCFLLKKCLYASVGRVTEKNTIKRIVYKVMYRIPNKWIFKSFDKMAKNIQITGILSFALMPL